MSALGRHSPGDTSWLTTAEQGSLFGLQLFYWALQALGRTACRPIVALVSLWYFARSGQARSASRLWLEACSGRRPRAWDVYQHFRTFAQVTVDRVFFLQGQFEYFDIVREGHETLQHLAHNRTGAIIVTAHMGSFDAMRTDGYAAQIPINVVGHFDNARMINTLFSRLNHESAVRVIHMGADGWGHVLAMHEVVARGEIVAIMADRVGLTERTCRVPFFGRPARFPTGAFEVAAVLGCPVYAAFSNYHEPNVYRATLELLADEGAVGRSERAAFAHSLATRFAERLEHHARRSPRSWFNFFDTWSTGDEPASK